MEKKIIFIGMLVCQIGVLGVVQQQQQQQQLLMERPQGNTEMEHAQNVRSQHLLNRRVLSNISEEHANQGRRLSDIQDSIQDLVDIQKKKKKKGRFTRWLKSFFVESDEEAMRQQKIQEKYFALAIKNDINKEEFKEMIYLLSSSTAKNNIIISMVNLPLAFNRRIIFNLDAYIENLYADVNTNFLSTFNNGELYTIQQNVRFALVYRNAYNYLFSTAKKVETTTVLTQVVTASVGSALAIASIGSAISLAVAPVVALGIPAIGYGLLLLLRHFKVPMFISLFPGGMLPPWIGALGWIPGMGPILNFCSNWLPGIQYTKWLSIPLRGGIVVSFCALLCWLIHRILQRWKADADFRKRMKKMLRENRGLLADPKGYLDSMYNRYYLKGIKAT